MAAAVISAAESRPDIASDSFVPIATPDIPQDRQD
jgi:hypothetical protein